MNSLMIGHPSAWWLRFSKGCRYDVAHLIARLSRYRNTVHLAHLSLARALTVLLAAGALACQSSPFDPAVANGIASIRIVPDSALVSGEPSAFDSDGTVDLSVELVDQDDQPISLDIAPIWTSSDRSVATVSPLGAVVGVRPGQATITATIGSVRGYSTVTVLPATDTGITIAAHRGFKSVFPENTLVAIAGAYELGADAAEIDVRLTVDDVPVVMHDVTVDRTTNGFGAVQFLTLAQIKQLDACSKFGPTWAPCSVPTLQEALETARGQGMLILDLEGPYTNASLVSVLEMVRSEGMQHRVLVTSFNYEMLEMLRRLDDMIPLGFLHSEIPTVQDITRLGRAVGMPDEHALFADPAATSALVRSALSQNIDIMAWTVSTPEDAKALIALGVRHIISDVPLDKSTLREVISESQSDRAITPSHHRSGRSSTADTAAVD